MKRADLQKQFQPFADKLAAELAAIAADHLDSLLESARAYAIEKLRAQLEGKPDAEEGDGPLDREVAGRDVSKRNVGRKHRRPRGMADRANRAGDAARPKTTTCSRCGEAGHNARTCGRESEDETQEPASTPLVVVPPPQLEQPSKSLCCDRSRGSSSTRSSTSLRWAGLLTTIVATSTSNSRC